MNFKHRLELVNFLEIANNSLSETLTEFKAAIEILAGVDQLYIDLLKVANEVSPPAAVLLINSHANKRAAIQLALSGQTLPTFMALRGLIESSLYANAMVSEPNMSEVWLARDKNVETKKNCRTVFSTANMFRILEKTHNSNFAENLQEAYDSTIDFGAHPNCRSIIQSIQIEELPDGKQKLTFTYLHGNQSFALKQSLLACAEIGYIAYFVNLGCLKTNPVKNELNQRALEFKPKISTLVELLDLKIEG